MINIHGPWTSKNGKNKIRIIQDGNKFEGYVGNAEEAKISLGTISKRTLNFKQTWHKGVNKGAVATVYGRLTSDNGNILLEFEGTRANGRAMKGKNAIYRDSIIGSWTPLSCANGETWRFNLVNKRDITGHYESVQIPDRMKISGKCERENENYFTIYLHMSAGRREAIRGEYRCPNLILNMPRNLGHQTVLLVRKSPEAMPQSEEYDPESIELTEGGYSISLIDTSLSSGKQPVRLDSNILSGAGKEYPTKRQPSDESQREDLRTELLSRHLPKTGSGCCCGSTENRLRCTLQ